jgi:Protein of unknown function (DUF3006)
MEEEVIKASLDRFEEDYAVVYSNDDNRRRFDLPRQMVTDAKPGMHLWLHIKGDSVTAVEIHNQETEDAKERISRKYERLRKGLRLK